MTDFLLNMSLLCTGPSASCSDYRVLKPLHTLSVLFSSFRFLSIPVMHDRFTSCFAHRQAVYRYLIGLVTHCFVYFRFFFLSLTGHCMKMFETNYSHDSSSFRLLWYMVGYSVGNGSVPTLYDA